MELEIEVEVKEWRKLEVGGLILEVVGWRLDVGGWRSRVEG